MKRIILIFITLICIGCSKDDNTEAKELELGDAALRAKIDGELFEIEINQLTMHNYQNAGNGGGGWTVGGCISGTSECIYLSTLDHTYDPNGLQVGEIVNFEFLYSNANKHYYNYNYNLTGPVSNIADIPVGQFEITERTAIYVKGVFSFVAHDYDNDVSVNITDGIFKAMIED
ncbi:hypothetical protein [uncultured Winogradskyella sp.]|uniref:hypothetical protein n=1 Tax=uncultured Winogradskyella sp. TaxID=395353 RepID=UPI00262EEED9|nr:hypothetical protein [uncultured Winogradskyella sp.]